VHLKEHIRKPLFGCVASASPLSGCVALASPVIGAPKGALPREVR